MSDPATPATPAAAPATPPSMSQRLIEFAGDALTPTYDERAYAAQLHIVITAWNLAIAPQNKNITRRFDAALLSTTPEIRRNAEETLARLVARKKEKYADDTRVVVEARLRRHETGVALDTKSYDYLVHGDKGL